MPEHVLPTWLVKLTGDKDRMAKFGIDWRPEKPILRQFRMSSFKFPACGVCKAFAQVESQAARVVNALLHNQPLSAENFDLLLDWLDKVRLGVWLAFLYLDQMIDEVRPVFRIFTRVSLYDRAVAIFKVAEVRRQL